MPKKGEKSQRMSVIAQSRRRGYHGEFKRLHDIEAGIIIVTCLPTRKQFIAHSLDVWDHVHKVTYRVRTCKNINPELEADIKLYGVSKFRVGVADTIMRLDDETDREYLNRLHILYSDYVQSNENIYRTRETLFRSIPIFKRRNINLLGKLKGRKNYDIECSCVYVLTCKSKKMHHVGISADFSKRWRSLISSLNTNSYKNARLQGDWNEYGPSSFTCDFVKIDEPDLYRTKKTVQGRLGDLHCY